jgi:hypothetical protein
LQPDDGGGGTLYVAKSGDENDDALRAYVLQLLRQPSATATAEGEADAEEAEELPTLIDLHATAADLALSHAALREQLAALHRVRLRLNNEEQALPQCSGLVKKMCRPCPDGGPKAFCDAITRECSDLFCNPMCERNSFTVAVTFGSGFGQEKKAHTGEALVAEFVAHACSAMLGCCADDARLFDYVENNVFQNDYPRPHLPSASCAHDPLDKAAASALCSKCKSAVTVKVEPAECTYPVVDASASNGKKKKLLLRRLLSENEDGGVGAALVEADGFPGKPAFKSLQERCVALQTKAKAKFSSMTSAFKKKVCGCMGCCDAVDCFFPVTKVIE